MSSYYHQILSLLKAAPTSQTGYIDLNKYLGTPNKCLGIPTKTRVGVIKGWIKEHTNLSQDDFEELLMELFKADIFEVKITPCIIMEKFPNLRHQLEPATIDKWLEYLTGWAEIDCLCQGTFTAKEMETNWPAWKKLLRNLNKSDNISKRRASLVLLCKPIRESQSEVLAKLAIENIENVKHEKDILITKAVSWVLREMIKNHRQLLENYLEKNTHTLPKIAVREVRNKLTTGRK